MMISFIHESKLTKKKVFIEKRSTTGLGIGFETSNESGNRQESSPTEGN